MNLYTETTHGGQHLEATRKAKYFAVHRDIDKDSKRWAITHIPTGRRVFTARTKQLAEEAAVELAAIPLDWANIIPAAQSPAEFKAQLHTLVRKYTYA